MNSVHVRRVSAGPNNRVHSCQANTSLTLHAPEGVGRGDQPRGNGDDRLEHCDRDVSKLEVLLQARLISRVGKEWTTQRGCLKRRGQRPAACRLMAWRQKEKRENKWRWNNEIWERSTEQRDGRMWSWQNAGRAREEEGGRPHDCIASRRREHHRVPALGRKHISRSTSPKPQAPSPSLNGDFLRLHLHPRKPTPKLLRVIGQFPSLKHQLYRGANRFPVTRCVARAYTCGDVL